MEDFKTGEVLIYKADNSKWKFIHYEPTGQTEFVTTKADFDGDRRLEDKSIVHVRAWNAEQNRWDENSHEAFPAASFKKK